MGISIQKKLFSGATGGAPIEIDTDTVIHEGPSFPNEMDEVWLYAVNSTANALRLSVTFLGKVIEAVVPPDQGLWQILPGLLLPSTTGTEVTGAGTLVYGASLIQWDADLTGDLSADQWVLIDDIPTPFQIDEVYVSVNGIDEQETYFVRLKTYWPYEDKAITTFKPLATNTVTATAADTGLLVTGWVHRMTEA
jgi:hypothetical protein